MRPTNFLKIIYSPVWMVLIGMAVRVLYMVMAHSYRVIVINNSVNEMERLAYSLQPAPASALPTWSIPARPPGPLPFIPG
jgi:hypothetical protein